MENALPSYEEASARLAEYMKSLCAYPIPSELVGLADAGGRTLASVLLADADQPRFDRSTRDGIACKARDASAHGFLRISGSVRAGESPAGSLGCGEAWEIMTGAPIPEGADAVAMIEHIETSDGRTRLLSARTLRAGENIVRHGSEARAGDELLQSGTHLGFPQMALAASCGAARLKVFRRPRVAILTTGDELAPIDEVPPPGRIRNSNGLMLAEMVRNIGGEPWLFAPVADSVAGLEDAIEEARAADMLVLSGGVSAGKYDFVEEALSRKGAQMIWTGVRMQPGKPLVFGEFQPLPGSSKSAGRPLPFFGLPGNPLSSAVTFLLFGAPVLKALAGRSEARPHFALAQIRGLVNDYAKAGLTRFLPARCSFGGQLNALPEVEVLPWQGSGDLVALAHANCFLVVPEDASRIATEPLTRVLLWEGSNA